jgi:hypothetical protein
MPRKKIKVTLQANPRDDSFIVKQVVNSVRWIPGQNLTEQEAKDLAASPIEVVITAARA